MSQTHRREVLAAYEKWWSRTEAAIDRHLEAGERNLARLVNLSYRDTVGEVPPGERISLVFGKEVPIPYLAANRLVRDWIADSVIARATSDVDAIVETGSGWGYNLFNIWLRGGPPVDYHAFELTEAGRRCCLKLRDAAVSCPRLAVHPFDYNDPDFSPLLGRYRKVLFYSSHSIEQVTELPTSFLDRVIGVAESVQVMHFEPVGWQFRDEIAVGLPDRGTTAYAEQHRYNRNLWRLLSDYAAAGRLTLEEAVPDVMGVKTYNPTSLVCWSASLRAAET